jgi:hypothetical protein
MPLVHIYIYMLK